MTITDEQGVKWLLSKAYDVGNRYIVMNERREVFLFKNKPSKGMYDWYDGRNDFGCLPMCLCESFNQLVSWEDKEPLDIGKYLGIVDWANVPVDTKVLVSDNGESWERKYFKRYAKENGEYKYICFADGCTFWSNKDNYNGIGWKYCKLAEDE